MAKAIIAPDQQRSTAGRFWTGARWLRRHPIILIGLVLLATMLLVAVFAPFVATHDPIRLTPTERLKSPSG
ncbi:MAG: D,D-dipeptide ABC transporter permease, partial [Geminicoccaceae bacterium]|nr:D,D-dipeptide ABC transporter permease [Geminicoccaceae bacterium]